MKFITHRTRIYLNERKTSTIQRLSDTLAKVEDILTSPDNEMMPQDDDLLKLTEVTLPWMLRTIGDHEPEDYAENASKWEESCREMSIASDNPWRTSVAETAMGWFQTVDANLIEEE
tara:strand:+ start:286 stop:636 length:351 start_codon:yes stop_codon:yes gene_type:complete